MDKNNISLPDVLIFDWDEGNLNKNRLKHDVEPSECEEIFYNNPIFFLDKKHSVAEIRYLAYGITNDRRFLTVVFTIREPKIRLISARDQSKKERKVYEQHE